MSIDEFSGIVYICGAGPGDPKLLTLRALDLIKQSEVILYDRLVGDEIIDLFPNDAEKIYVGRNVGDPTTHQDKTNQFMLKYAKMGRKVLRLKGGDPFIFGRGGEEAEILKENNIPFEIIPGITSGIGAAIYSGIPLTHRKYGSTVAFVTGHEDPDKKTPEVRWEKLLQAVDTVVIYMGTEKLNIIIEKINTGNNNAKTPVAIIQNGTLKNQKIIKGTLEDIVEIARKSKVKPPAIVIIGNIVKLNETINWFGDHK
ncbi:MAG: uroporphyrinogen-III C-methyltransferase [Candidatus Nitrosocosmicus sp.]|jgi:uroporphyrin-III C-methyltransferase|uniref:uroporphyrinogen-III C-methyltransferase n=1 Tax=Candidatus Nitrosocosmicus agrestis TaxID=2563600 RepID=UPI00122E99C2|nr:uroporphyrinogen-III C-methyltransferase [Candidatus Nitrosocosmicus sp. SS]KAA2283059.1 uroporphyrinogen-III C-methyltransferase [Candidatus Nitrosocosmicus sp. SS]KAF0868518.1 uroporphyrinogen-III C-methyltransferase [Candidatus Nitrosocosmicus sp. SS]MDR4490093.1 uroporphyrinogen-III C-methyltransferase [Candidatus Nitrosocosmicus sp.]